MDIAVPADHRVKLKESEKRINTSTLLVNWKNKVISIVIGALGTVTQELINGVEDLEVGGRVETIQTTALLISAKILRRVLDTWGDLLSLNLTPVWKTRKRVATTITTAAAEFRYVSKINESEMGLGYQILDEVYKSVNRERTFVGQVKVYKIRNKTMTNIGCVIISNVMYLSPVIWLKEVGRL